MKNFNILKTDSIENPILVVGCLPYDPLEQKDEIEKELGSIHYKGEIIIDYLLYNGNKQNRFIKYFFDGNNINLRSSEICKQLPDEIKKISISYYHHNYTNIDFSNISKPLRYLIKNNVIL